jgi:quercetin dioxygenase-like cupin family protein
MKQLVHAALLATAGALGTAAAQDTAPAQVQQQTIERAGSLPSSQGPEQNFTGRVRVDPIFAVTADAPYSAAFVTFEPDARSAWHTHPGGQRLG